MINGPRCSLPNPKLILNTTRDTHRGPAQPKFLPLLDEVHVDEKWFFLCRDGESCIIVSDEEEPPKRHVSHKSHIAKVTFPCAMARPRRLPNGTWWDGKVGIWPIGECTVAQRSSANRPAGTEESKKETIDRDKHREMVINEVVPAIQSAFPACEQSRCGTMCIQQDGAPSHGITQNEDDGWRQDMEAMGLSEQIKLVAQPPNSPDMNINDLGFFNALQAMHHGCCPKNGKELFKW